MMRENFQVIRELFEFAALKTGNFLLTQINGQFLKINALMAGGVLVGHIECGRWIILTHVLNFKLIRQESIKGLLETVKYYKKENSKGFHVESSKSPPLVFGTKCMLTAVGLDKQVSGSGQSYSRTEALNKKTKPEL
ncbi:hypothetical protein ISN44_As04g038320 [Arabidopsis suecica]|uniref:Uncharacterized protein n=1 Tax=Arabidopsis suecica TaxID=45249 RepID=A0A8T2EGI6_ARASU|nr:hypothetical protein ISN44_As04g038320 [Arabidopsis suecica]